MQRTIRPMLVLLAAIAGLALGAAPARAGDPSGRQGRLVILSTTGAARDSLPVLRIQPHSEEISRQLSCGFISTMLHLYRCEQSYLHGGRSEACEPAYLLLSRQQGGFPRFGFYLGDEKKAGVGYVDLHERSPLAGAFGAVDQIFPHELGHVILHQLAGEATGVRAGQVHAVGVCTDPLTAFDEGFAEHFQVQACDDPDAIPSTRALTADDSRQRGALASFARLRQELGAGLAFFPGARMTFPLWFSGAEQIQRYYEVKADAFARTPRIPDRLLSHSRLYDAYVLENTLPGLPDGQVKPLSRLVSTEGVVSAFFCRMVERPALRRPVADPAFYARFDVRPEELNPVEHVYLKLFHVFATARPHDLAAFLCGYRAAFPEEAAALDSVATEVLLSPAADPPPQIWLAVAGAPVGTSVFDQFRGQPRPRIFDLNAAEATDLAALPAMTPAWAESLARRIPYRNLEDLRRIPGLPEAIRTSIVQTAGAFAARNPSGENVEESLNMGRIFSPYLWRALLAWLLAAVFGTWATRVIRPGPWVRCALRGIIGGLAGLLFGWVGGGAPGLTAALGATVLFGVPAAMWTALSRRGLRETIFALAAWTAAALPAAILVTPW